MKHREEFIEQMKNHEKIKRYQELEIYIENNAYIQEIFEQLKLIQKQLVNAQNIDKKESVNAFTKQYNDLYNQIIDFPLIAEYLALQSEINDALQQITQIIEQGIVSDLL